MHRFLSTAGTMMTILLRQGVLLALLVGLNWWPQVAWGLEFRQQDRLEGLNVNDEPTVQRKRHSGGLAPSGVRSDGVAFGRNYQPVTTVAPESGSKTKSNTIVPNRLKRGSERKRMSSKRRNFAADKSASLSIHVPTTMEHILGGTLGGMSGVLAAYPLDTVRVRMQMCAKRHGPLRMASDLLREAGVAGFYRGVASPVAGAALIKSSVFGGYGIFQTLVRRVTGKEHGELTLLEVGAAAMGSGLVATFVVCPVERVKVVMQSTPTTGAIAESFARGAVRRGARAAGGGSAQAGYANAWACTKSLVKQQGLSGGLYAGLSPTLLRVGPGYMCYFLTYEAIKRFLIRGDISSSNGSTPASSDKMLMLKTAVAGAAAGAASCFPVYPFDVVKSRMQSVAAGGPGMMATAASMWRSEGLRPFLHGVIPSVLCSTMVNACTFVVYERVMESIIKRRVAAVVMTEHEKDDVLTEHSPEVLVQ